MNDVFITENFLLQNDRAVELYHGFARDLPIIDYHCHLPPRQIAEDHRFANLTQIWLYGDHYKWRAMRTAGVAERYCTGDASDWEKFQKWAEVVPRTLRNPLYHWTHLELKRPLGVSDRLLGPRTARSIWDDCNARLACDDMSCRGILRQMRVEVVCTTDDPTDSLEHHAAIAAETKGTVPFLPTHAPDDRSSAGTTKWSRQKSGQSPFSTRVLPTFRPDRALRSTMSRRSIAMSTAWPRLPGPTSATPCRATWKPCGSGTISSTAPAAAFPITGWRRSMTSKARCWRRTAFLRGSAAGSGRRPRRPLASARPCSTNWPSGTTNAAGRSSSTSARLGTTIHGCSPLGPDTGFDSIGDGAYARGLARFLDRLDRTNQLAKTVLYNINPSHNEMLATMIGNFQDGSVPGKLQFGSSWWFLDQKDGMEKQLDCLSNAGLLSRLWAC